MRTSARGQAMAELALALMVFVTVVVFGIHFAEVGYLSLRVQEAAVAPLWDATALRVHRMRPQQGNIGDFSSFPSIAPDVMADAQDRYRDFDGRRSVNGSTSITHVFTRMDGMVVQCAEDTRIEFDVPRSRRPALAQPSPGGGDWPVGIPNQPRGNANDTVLDGIYENVGGVGCRAEADLRTLPALTTTFLEGASGFFKEEHAALRQMKSCAAGRGVGGVCQGSYSILLGDFAFADTDVSGSCPLQPELPEVPCGDNPAYYYAVQKVFDNNERAAGSHATEFAEFFAGYSPIDENDFFMSYRGIEHGYIETATPTGEPMDMMDRPRNTGGVSDRPPKRRRSDTCFLGLQGC
jgi:hypothetical protein